MHSKEKGKEQSISYNPRKPRADRDHKLSSPVVLNGEEFVPCGQMLETFLNARGCYRYLMAEAWDAGRHPTMRSSSDPKYQ